MNTGPDTSLPSTAPRRASGASPRRRALARITTGACWAVAAAALLGSLLWTISSWAWQIDLLANLGAQILLLTLIALGIVLVLRRWRAAGVLAFACALHLWPLMTARAAWWPRSTPAAQTTPNLVRVLHYNDSSCSDKAEVYALMDRSGADVLHILCPPIPQQNEVIDGPGLEKEYPGKVVRHFQTVEHGAATQITAAFIVSRWPIRPVDISAAGPMAAHLMVGIVERPEGEFAIIGVHPRSPRNASRWHDGNSVVDVTARVTNALRECGWPVLVMTDLNSTPSGARSRTLWSEAALRRSKPLLLMRGTFPDTVQSGLRKDSARLTPGWWPLSIAIDDVMITPGIGVESWRVLPFLRGEHTPILVELSVPPGAKGTWEANLLSR